jgi:hypothetical protein
MKFGIWSEGYIVSGNSSQANLIGTQEGKDFSDAIVKYAVDHPEFDEYLLQKDGNWYFWGCQLFDNEENARKSFG